MRGRGHEHVGWTKPGKYSRFGHDYGFSGDGTIWTNLQCNFSKWRNQEVILDMGGSFCASLAIYLPLLNDDEKW